MNTRLVVVMRRDLKLPVGAMCAQVAHASDQWMRTAVIESQKITVEELFDDFEIDWMKEPYISILEVANLDELDYIIDQAVDSGLIVSEFRDTIYSENLKVKIPNVLTGISIGPNDYDLISTITGNLKPLYKDGV